MELSTKKFYINVFRSAMTVLDREISAGKKSIMIFFDEVWLPHE